MGRTATHPGRNHAEARLAGPGALAAAGALIGVMFMGSTLLTPLYPLYRRDYGLSIIAITLLYSVYVVGNLVAVLFLGRLSDQVGRRKVALGAMALAALSAVGFLFADGAAWLFGARIVSGLSVGLAAGAGAAWIAELIGGKDRAPAATVATAANFFGIAVGPILAGLLAQYAAWPTRLPFVAYLGLLAVVAPAIALARETVDARGARLELKPRLGVPADKRVAFIPPAVSVFGAMALVGFYAALIPTVVEALGQTNLAVGGAIAAVMFLAGGLTILATQTVSARLAMLWGLGLMAPSVALLALAEAARSMPLTIAGAVLGGVAAALGYRGSLQVANELAPADKRAELVSSYFVAAFAGNALPVIGVGVLTARASASLAAAVFAVVIGAFAIGALALELVRTRQRR